MVFITTLFVTALLISQLNAGLLLDSPYNKYYKTYLQKCVIPSFEAMICAGVTTAAFKKHIGNMVNCIATLKSALSEGCCSNPAGIVLTSKAYCAYLDCKHRTFSDFSAILHPTDAQIYTFMDKNYQDLDKLSDSLCSEGFSIDGVLGLLGNYKENEGIIKSVDGQKKDLEEYKKHYAAMPETSLNDAMKRIEINYNRLKTAFEAEPIISIRVTDIL